MDTSIVINFYFNCLRCPNISIKLHLKKLKKKLEDMRMKLGNTLHFMLGLVPFHGG